MTILETTIRTTAALAAILVLCASPAAAASDFVGTWGATKASCRLPQDAQGAPMILTLTSLDQHETHCQLALTRNAASPWIARAKCVVEGDQQNHTFKFTVRGDRLVVSERGVADKAYVKCR